MIDPKRHTARSTDYLQYIREQPCEVCTMTPCDPAHTFTGGTGMKGSDYSCIPLCRIHHGEQHQIGAHTFARKYNLDYNEIRFRMIHGYVVQVAA